MSNLKLVYKLVKGNLKALLSIDTTPNCKEGCDLFPWIAPLSIIRYGSRVSVKQGGIKYLSMT